MKMDKVLEALKEDYALRASLKRKHLKVQDELEDEIDDLEQSLITSKIIPELEQYAKILLNDLECEVYLAIKKDAKGDVLVGDELVKTPSSAETSGCFDEGKPEEEPLDYPILTIPVKFHQRKYLGSDFWETLYRTEEKQGDIRKPLHVSDSITNACCVAKRNNKYGIFVYSGNFPHYADPKIWSIREPFLFSDVRICCESFVGNCGFVAVCMNGKWGAVEVSFDYYLQLVVPFQYRTWEEAAIEVEQLMGRHLFSEWFSFEKFEVGENGNPSNNPKAILGEDIASNAGVILNQSNKDFAKGKHLRITFDDGTVFEGNNAKDSFINALKKIGLNKIPQVGIKCSGYNLVDTCKRTDKGRAWQEKVGDLYVYIYFNNPTKVDFLLRIADYYHLNIKIEAI